MYTLAFIIPLFLLSLYGIMLFYYRRGWNSISAFNLKKAIVTSHGSMISVIVPARNEEENISKLLDSLISQSLPLDKFEVIVVDDFSEDNTAELVRQYSSKNIRLISLKDELGEEKINSYKKKAIEIAIKKSNGELIVTTDADCVAPSDWLKNIHAFYQIHQSAMIVMPVLIENNKSFFEIFQCIDFMTLQGITAAAAEKKFHRMCNGANLAYTKKIFNEVGGFGSIDNIASGDDMLLMQKIAKTYPDDIHYLKSTEVIVRARACETLNDFLHQRIRWAGKSGKYSDKSILPVLLLVYFMNVSLFGLLFIAVFSENSSEALGVFFYLLAFKIMIELYFIFPIAAFFRKVDLLWIFPLLQPFHILYTVAAGFLGFIGKYSWKGRQVK